jgi:hypothetical protein
MASTSDIKNGLCIKYNNDIYKIIEFLHVKPGKGPAFVRTKLKSLSLSIAGATGPFRDSSVLNTIYSLILQPLSNNFQTNLF